MLYYLKFLDPKQNSKEFKDAFLKKLQFCSIQYEFNDEFKDVKEKQERLNYLQELSELLNDQNNVINFVIPHLDHVMEMIEKNIFRPLPIIKKTNAPAELGMEEEEVIIDPAWLHLQVSFIF